MSELTGVRFSLEDLEEIQEYRRAQPDLPAKGTAIRELVRRGLRDWRKEAAKDRKERKQ
jgi:hypothetical protein